MAVASLRDSLCLAKHDVARRSKPRRVAGQEGAAVRGNRQRRPHDWRGNGALRRWPVVAVLLLIAAALVRLDRKPPQTTAVPKGPVAGSAHVIDGDSLRIGGEEIRLQGIDAPEGPQTCRRDGREWDCGEDSRRTLQRLIGNATVTCRSVERDQHARLLGRCEAGGRDLNAAMVEAGMAVAYGGYRDEERRAKAARRGLWAGEFEMPRDWRRERGIGGR